MFQIAHAYSQSLKNNIECFFLKNSYTPMQASQPTKYLDNIFSKVKFVDSLPSDPRIVYEHGFNYSCLNVNWSVDNMFHGYFQSSKNFNEHISEVIELFEPSDKFLKFMEEKYPILFTNQETVSIHIRRGDYLSIPHVLPTIDISYVKKCMNLFDHNTIFFIFSDDIPWIKSNFEFKNCHIPIGLEDYESLWFMSLCNHNIISNSSFSWWSAFLNKNKEKKVYVPNIWFGNNGPNPYDDIYEKNWNQVQVKIINNTLQCY
jgi:hypothetical protein